MLENGEVFTGEHKFGKRDGYGIHIIPNKSKYVGTYKDGKKNGREILTGSDAEKYVGNFVDDLQHGLGTETWPDGTRKYDGEFKAGMYHGKRYIQMV